MKAPVIVTTDARPQAANMSSPSPSPSPSSSLSRRRRLAVFAAVNAVAAWGGAIALIAGGTDFGSVLNRRLPFHSPVLAGVALAVIVAIPLSLLTRAAWVGTPSTNSLALAVGVLLVGWIIVQVAVLRAFSFFQPFYLVVGVWFVGASRRVNVSRRLRGVLLAAAGTIVVAIGAGLMPHLVKNGLTFIAVIALAAAIAGTALLVVGGRAAVAGRRLPGKIAGGGATVVVAALVAWLVAPAVAATNVPRTHPTTSPASLGLDYESVTVRTSDGIQLAGWFFPGTNRAGVVVMHGSGSTRSSVLDQAAALSTAGYAVLLVDARGHGESGGTAMDFGWHGDADVSAGVAFLAARVDVDPGRIGVVGFSMGGEEAIGAAASDQRIRAVVAEGATGRQAADKAWLSDSYGWRGWVQEQFEKVEYGVAAYLSTLSPPRSLRSAVARSSGAEFLLITAGNVADEGRAAAFIESAAADRVTLWNVAGAGHTGGYRTDPSAWKQHVVEFLDQTLR